MNIADKKSFRFLENIALRCRHNQGSQRMRRGKYRSPAHSTHVNKDGHMAK
jgi:hypothetical protein